ncbi:UNVERIFIED_CONTAM: hypothetical protein GTU68_039227 [Idotea baltica]|nr:hypothetical protein [Idotea baltica]
MPKITGTIYDLKLAYRFTIARSSKTEQPSLIICYQDQGIKGYGECTDHAYYKFSVTQGLQQMLSVRDKLASMAGSHPTEFYSAIHKLLPETPFLRCAIDEAYWDWYGKLHQNKTHQLLDLSAPHECFTSYTIGIDNMDQMKAKMDAHPWPAYKIKLSAVHDAGFVQELIRHARVPLCIDANASWSAEQLISMTRHMTTKTVPFIEQPMPREAWDEMTQTKNLTPIPLIADESCVNINDLEACARSFDGVNVKLMKCGGITPAYELLQAAKKRGLKTMIGCMTESSIGISAATHLIQLADYIDLDGALLLANDPAIGIDWTSTGPIWPSTMGNGAVLNQTMIDL